MRHHAHAMGHSSIALRTGTQGVSDSRFRSGEQALCRLFLLLLSLAWLKLTWFLYGLHGSLLLVGCFTRLTCMLGAILAVAHNDSERSVWAVLYQSASE